MPGEEEDKKIFEATIAKQDIIWVGTRYRWPKDGLPCHNGGRISDKQYQQVVGREAQKNHTHFFNIELFEYILSKMESKHIKYSP